MGYTQTLNAKSPKKKTQIQTKKKTHTTLEMPKVFLNVKIPLKNLQEYDMNTILDATQVVLSSNFGTTSIFKEELMSKNLVATLGAYAGFEREYLLLQVVAKTKYPEEVIPLIKQKIYHLEILEKDIERKKKSEIANLVLGYEDPESVNDYISYSIAKFGHIWDNEKETVENLTIEKITDIISKISMKEMAILVAKPKTHEKQESSLK